MNPLELQKLVLLTLAAGADSRLGNGRHYLFQTVRSRVHSEPRPTTEQFMQVVWSLVAQGLAYIDFSQQATENWSLHLTASGNAAATDEASTPDDPSGYTQRLRAIVGLPETVFSYASEALGAYGAQLYRGATILLGVASEALVLDASEAFSLTMQSGERDQFLEAIHSRKRSTLAKFELFRVKLSSNTNALPEELLEGLDLNVHAVADLLRSNRNSVGHPSGAVVSREDTFTSLQLFIRYAHKLCALAVRCRAADA